MLQNALKLTQKLQFLSKFQFAVAQTQAPNGRNKTKPEPVVVMESAAVKVEITILFFQVTHKPPALDQG